MIPITISTETFALTPPHEEVRLPETKAEFRAVLQRAEAGDAAAQYLVACTYRAQGEELMEELRALPSGSPRMRAPYNIGERDPLSDGAQEYYHMAFSWFERAADRGDPEALYALSRCYLLGEGTAAHLGKGRQLLKEAAEKGAFAAQYDLAMLYYHGYGEKAASYVTPGYVAQDFDQAVFWLQKAAAQGDAMALYFLGKCCEEGTGTEQNKAFAFAFYRRSAELENPWAQCALGRCYEYGVGTDPDPDRAVSYYRKAADGGDAEAWDALERLGK